jgi:hypothetical protein
MLTYYLLQDRSVNTSVQTEWSFYLDGAGNFLSIHKLHELLTSQLNLNLTGKVASRLVYAQYAIWDVLELVWFVTTRQTRDKQPLQTPTAKKSFNLHAYKFLLQKSGPNRTPKGILVKKPRLALKVRVTKVRK